MSSAPFSLPQFGVSIKGKSTNLAQGTQAQIALDQSNAQIISPVLMPNSFLTLAGNLCTGTWPAAATAAPSATALSAFAIYNQAGSSVNLHIQSISTYLSTLTATTTATAIGLVPFTQTPTATATTGTAKANGLIGQGNAVQAIQYVSGTLVGAVTTSIRIVASWYLDLAAGDTIGIVRDDVNGAIIVPPGSGFSLCGIGGTVADVTIGVSMCWAEIPV